MQPADHEPLVFRAPEGLPILVLTRKVGEKIRIGSDIVLIVVAVEGYRVRLGVEAPPNVPIHRVEFQTCERRSGEDEPQVIE